jgi:hypothetical protein
VEGKQGFVEEIIHWWGSQLEIKSRKHNLKYGLVVSVSLSSFICIEQWLRYSKDRFIPESVQPRATMFTPWLSGT